MLPDERDPPLVAPSTVVVEPGDNLWDLSAAALARATGRERAALGDDEIARYWNVVCDANRATVALRRREPHLSGRGPGASAVAVSASVSRRNRS